MCQKPFGGRITFATLFRAPRFCPRCLKRYAPGSHATAVPIDGGLVRYTFVYDEENADHHLTVLLSDRLGPLFLEASDWDRAGAVTVLLEAAEAATIDSWFAAIAAFRDVRFFSLFRVELDQFEDLFQNLSEKTVKNMRTIYKHHNFAVK
ncbi:MAG TPA: hypothetical protein DCR44_01775 [Acholeplasmatales bacterium]|nr:MAG: hypothetical protein A2Y16_06225 [Tenericutes bacterium GWF2_57_13]HAQ56122.1 hypothetical protein [Acholeplasmatales bacterium]